MRKFFKLLALQSPANVLARRRRKTAAGGKCCREQAQARQAQGGCSDGRVRGRNKAGDQERYSLPLRDRLAVDGPLL